MGDTYCSLVPVSVSRASAGAVAKKFISHLIDGSIIDDRQSACVLGSSTGYPPAKSFITVIENPDTGLLQLSTNGLAITTGRQVFHAAGVDEIRCPACGCNNIDSDWGELLDEWVRETGKDHLLCQGCGAAVSIVDYRFSPVWAFGELGFTFWNWGIFKQEFLREVEEVIGHRIVVVYGKI